MEFHLMNWAVHVGAAHRLPLIGCGPRNRRLRTNHSMLFATRLSLLLFLLALWAGLRAIAKDLSAAELVRYRQTQQHMGTYFTFTIYAADPEQANAAFAAAFAKIGELDDCLSNYKSDSEVNRLSASSPHASPVAVGPDVWQVLVRSEQYSELSQGAFDVTIGPVTKLWRRARRTHRLPSDDQLRKALSAVGYQHLKLQPEDHSVQMLHPGMLLDLGGIAKGYALDRALQTFRDAGIECALLDGGGDLLAGAAPPGQVGWKIGVGDVDSDPARFYSLRAAHQAVATSGDLYQYVEIDGVRYSHLVDPRTGLGLTQRSSVTVVARDATAADALASTVSVLGPERGVQLVETLPGVEVRMLTIKDGQVRVHRSSGFPALESESVGESGATEESGS
jgi:thiamine biosynthesis lipoprotein